MTLNKITLSAFVAAAITFTACGGGSTGGDTPDPTPTPTPTGVCNDGNTIAGNIDFDLVLTADTCLDGKVVVEAGASITASNITIAGVTGTKAWLEVLPGGKLNATNVIFTSEEALDGKAEAAGQWGGVTLIGNDGDGDQVEGYEVDGVEPGVGTETDNSGMIMNCQFNNTGIAVEQDKEINGLSLVGVGSGTQIDGVSVNRSGDDAIEIWGGHVNLANVSIDGTGDDGFDTDDGWAGTVTGLSVKNVTNAGIETSGKTHPTYINVTIDTTGAQATEDVGGAVYLKKTGIGGFFENMTIIDNADNTFGTFVADAVDLANFSVTGLALSGTNTAGLVTEGPKYDANVSTTAQVAALINEI